MHNPDSLEPLHDESEPSEDGESPARTLVSIAGEALERPAIRLGPTRVRFLSRIAEMLQAAGIREIFQNFRCFHGPPVV